MRFFKRRHTRVQGKLLSTSSRDPVRDPKFDWRLARTENAEAFLQLLRTDELSPQSMRQFRQVESDWSERDASIKSARQAAGLPAVHPLADAESHWVTTSCRGSGLDL
jgi:hypothetical protein